MSHLGQKQTRKGLAECPLYSQKQTLRSPANMSAMCQKRTLHLTYIAAE